MENNINFNTLNNGTADATLFIQTLLDKGGYVYIPNGTYKITKPLIIHSNTHLHLENNATFFLSDYANCSLIDNEGLYSGETDKNITIEGGIWDGNNSKQERAKIPNETHPGDANEDKPCNKDEYISNIYLVLLMRFIHTENLCIKNLTLKNPTSFAMHIADAKYFTVSNIVLDFDLKKPNMDGIHIQGPARFGKITNISGNANDDHVALCANGTIRSEITHGDIEDVDIDGIYCDNGYTGVRLLSRGDAIRNITIKNIHGEFRYYAISFTHHYPVKKEKPILLENVHISNVFVSKSDKDFPKETLPHGALIWFESDINAKNVVIENVYRKETSPLSTAPTIRISPNANLKNVTIRNLYQEFSGEYIEGIENNGNTQNLKTENIY